MRRNRPYGLYLLALTTSITAVLCALKLIGKLECSWWLATLPTSAPFALFILLLFICIIIDLFSGFNHNKEDEDDLFGK